MVLYTHERFIFIFSVDCLWNAYGEWNSCSVSCGVGEQQRTRNIKTSAAFGGKNCTGVANETRACGITECPGMITIFH